MPAKSRAESKKDEIPLNAQITVRMQKECMIDSHQLNQLNTAMTDGIRRNKIALDQVNQLIDYLNELHDDKMPQTGIDSYQKLFNMLARHFKIESTTPTPKLLHYLRRISTRLSKTDNGLSNDKRTLYISNVSKKESENLHGYVRHEMEDRLYLNFNLLQHNTSTEFIMLVLIHEASHLFVDTADHAYYHKTESNPDCSLMERVLFQANSRNITDKDITLFKRLNNADSMAYFVTELTSDTNVYLPAEPNVASKKNTYMGTFFNQVTATSVDTDAAKKILSKGLLIGAAFALHTATISFTL